MSSFAKGQLSSQKRELLKTLLTEEGISVPEAALIPRNRKESTSFLLSFAQQRLWFLDQLFPGNSFYNIPAALPISTPLHPPLLERCLNQIVERHEILRTSFKTVDGQPVQIVAPHLELPLEICDLTRLDHGNRQAEAERLAAAAVTRSFDLSRAPLLRATLFRLAAYEHFLLLTMHHIISDAWSIGILWRELIELYAASFNGRRPALPPLPVQYADYAVWQREYLSGDVLERQLQYWEQQLRDVQPLELPTDKPRPPVPSFRGGNCVFTLDAGTTARLRQLAQQQGATLFMTLLAGFAALLWRYTGQSQIVVGAPVSGRTRAELESLIGFFVNTLVLPIEVGSNPSFTVLLERVRELTLAAYEYQDVPFEMLVERLQPERDLSRNPLFQLVFQLLNLPGANNNSAAPAPTTTLEVRRGTTMFDLAVSLWEAGGGLCGGIEYNEDLYEEPAIKRMAGHYQRLLEQAAKEPERRLSEWELLSASERTELLHTFNRTVASLPQHTSLPALFDAQVERTPAATALICDEQEITYSELQRRANRLARHLRRTGVGPETRVGICLPRSIEMVVAVLGILKTGAAYVPLDVSYPAERLAWMANDAQLQIIVSNPEVLPEALRGTTQLVDMRDLVNEDEDESGRVEIHGDNLAYVIYTSGSTGRPKGVMVTHAGLCNVAAAQARILGINSTDHVLQFASLSFDASIFEMLFAWGVGAAVCIIPQGSLPLGPELHRLLTKYSVTTVTLPPSALTTVEPDSSLPLKTITVAGEACSVELVDRWASRCSFFNLYGPTEASIWATVARCNSGSGKPSIGTPIDNVCTFVLDEWLQPAPIGVTGELFLGGVGLARGYLNRPELTAAAFVPHPFSSEAGARLYRTGDLVRYRADGQLEFIGRKDQQVKIRGYRIEPGEVEAALRRHESIAEVVVSARGDGDGNKQLAAYVVAAAGQEVDPAVLRAHLLDHLPAYMIPSSFMQLEQLPLMTSGKVDRNRLPEHAGRVVRQRYVAPRTHVERVLAQIWSDVLRVERVGVQDNFFELGGDSILSIQVIARAARAGVQLTALQLFERQTIAELALVAGSVSIPQAEQDLVTGNVPLTPIQQWFFELDLVDPHHFNQAVLFDVPQSIDPNLLKQSMHELVMHHDALRLRFHREQGQVLQTHSDQEEEISLATVDLSSFPESEHDGIIQARAGELQGSLDLSAGPLVRVMLFESGSVRPKRLLIVIHHLIVDGVSWRILLEDLTTAYHQLSRSEPVVLPAKTNSFKQWANRLKEHAQSADLKRESDYWLRLANVKNDPLPVDFVSDAPNTVASARDVCISLTQEETQSLLRDVATAYRTQVNDVLLSALLQTFATWTGSSSMLIDLEGHGREPIFADVELSRTVGWFTTMFPVFLNCDGVVETGDKLKTVKEQLRSIPNHGIGFGILRYLSNDAETRRRMRELPSPQVSFNYLGQFANSGSNVLPQSETPASSGQVSSSRNERDHLIEINGSITNDRLQFIWTYSNTQYKASTIEFLAEGFLKALRELIIHCRDIGTKSYTPSDFPKARVSQRELDKLLRKVKKGTPEDGTHDDRKH